MPLSCHYLGESPFLLATLLTPPIGGLNEHDLEATDEDKYSTLRQELKSPAYFSGSKKSNTTFFRCVVQLVHEC